MSEYTGAGNGLNRIDHHHAEIVNRGNIGVDDAGCKALWDADHPDGPLELPARAVRVA